MFVALESLCKRAETEICKFRYGSDACSLSRDKVGYHRRKNERQLQGKQLRRAYSNSFTRVVYREIAKAPPPLRAIVDRNNNYQN